MKLRSSWGKGLAVLALMAALVCTSCSTAWIGQAEEIVAALIPAASNVIALVAALQGKTASAQDLQAIQSAGTQATADLQLIQSLIAEYQNADASAKPGVLNQIQSTIGAVQGNLNGLLASLHIKDSATQAKVTAVVGLVLSEVQSLAAILPVVSGSPAVGARSAAGTGHPTTDVRQPRVPLSASEFVKSYNATLSAKTGNADLDQATGGLRIHRHSKLARWETAGMLK